MQKKTTEKQHRDRVSIEKGREGKWKVKGECKKQRESERERAIEKKIQRESNRK